MKTKRLSIKVAETETGFRAVFLPDTRGTRGVRDIVPGVGATPEAAVAALLVDGWDRVKYDRSNL